MHRLLTKTQVASVEKLMKAITVALEHAYAKGVNDGHDLLGSLARGEVGIAELNKAAIKGVRKAKFRD